MKVARLLPVVAIVGVIITACGGGNNTTTTTATVPSDLSISSFDASFSYMAKLKDLTAAGKGKVAVLLPDTTSSVRYVQFDEPYLRKALEGAGYKSSDFTITNAQGQEAQELAQAQTAITNGATVLIMDPLNSTVGSQIQNLASQKGVKVISYDRATFTGTTNSQGMKRVGEQVATDWKNDVGQTIFQQAYTANNAINATVEANDGLGNAVVTVLKSKGVKAKQVPTTGQDATPDGMANVLTDFQCGSVYKAVYLEAQAAVALATVLRAGQTPPPALVNGTTSPPSTVGATRQQPAVLLVPIWVNKANMKDTVIKDNF